MNAPTINPDSLPESLRELVRVLGEADTLRLIGAHGGARMTVPKAPKADHPLRLVLSDAAFIRLVAEYGGEALDLPKGDAYLRELRHEQVRACRRQEKTIDEIAEATGYTRRHVINILGGHADGADRYTLDLFAEEASPHGEVGSANDPFGLSARSVR